MLTPATPPTSSLERLVTALRRAGWTTPEIAQICASVPSHDLALTIQHVDFVLGVQSLIASIREDLKPLHELRSMVTTTLEEQKALMAKLYQTMKPVSSADIQPLNEGELS